MSHWTILCKNNKLLSSKFHDRLPRSIKTWRMSECTSVETFLNNKNYGNISLNVEKQNAKDKQQTFSLDLSFKISTFKFDLYLDVYEGWEKGAIIFDFAFPFIHFFFVFFYIITNYCRWNFSYMFIGKMIARFSSPLPEIKRTVLDWVVSEKNL